MKIQINGFDIEINTEETNMVVKVMDASGKELSNNTYEQSLDDNGGPNPVDMPSAEETASDDSNPEGNEPPADDVQGTEGDSTVGTEEETPETEVSENELEEGFCPSFEQWKAIQESKKAKPTKKPKPNK